MTFNETPLRLLLIRHGATTWNDEDRVIGSTDLPLSANGKNQADQLSHRLGIEEIDQVISSNMQRAVETAHILADECGLKVEIDTRIREADFGLWEGLTLGEIQEKYAGSFHRWQSDPASSPPGGEDPKRLKKRIDSFLADLRENHPGEIVAIVSHGVALQTIITSLLDIPYKNDWYFYMYNGSISEVEVTSERAVLVYLNDIQHLSARSHWKD